MVPRAGLEPARSCPRGILSPLCLPISPPRHRWRRGSESNRPRRICNPLHNLSATPPIYCLSITTKTICDQPMLGKDVGAGNETRTRDPDLGKVVLYQLSYSRVAVCFILHLYKCLSTFIFNFI